MKRVPRLLPLCLFAALALKPQPPKPLPQPLARFMPPGALLYLESPDFKSLLDGWTHSSVERNWLASDNARAFRRSRLYIKLERVQKQFAAAMRFLPDASFADSVAGGHSALGLYDIGRLQFLYVTDLPQASVAASVLSKARATFAPRKAAGVEYFIHQDSAHHRALAFAAVGRRLFIATREDLMVHALELDAHSPQSSLLGQRWFARALGASPSLGDLRMALDLPALIKTPYFRSYWVMRNATDLKPFRAEVVDAFRSPAEIREERVLIRSSSENAPTATPPNDRALAKILRFVPPTAGLYRAWVHPSVARVVALLEQKILAPHPGPAVASQFAPTLASLDGVVGSANDLETRIDLPPPSAPESSFAGAPLRKLFKVFPPDAILEIESTHLAPGQEFAGTEAAIVLRSRTAWKGSQARAALRYSIESRWTVSGLGASWTPARAPGGAVFVWNGLHHLTVAVRGRDLIVATRPDFAAAILSRASAPAASRVGIYAAGFRHDLERRSLAQMLHWIELPAAGQLQAGASPGGNAPLFFSQNLASLSRALAPIASESLIVRDEGNRVRETVIYRLQP